MTIVCKFGGTSVATAAKILKIRDFVASNPDRRYVVVSAPGKRFPGDEKITDMLRRCIRARSAGADWLVIFGRIIKRYDEIISKLDINLDLSAEYEKIAGVIETGEPTQHDYIESRGEYLMGLVMARVLGYEFVDAAELIKFDRYGYNEDFTQDLVASQLIGVPQAVVPGYYGAMLDGRIKIFDRGGSDITGAIIARGVSAKLYENCTDVAGVLACDPRIVPEAHTVLEMTHKEARQFAYMGATVLHPDALLPVWRANIPTRVLNPFDSDAKSTLISDSVHHDEGSIVGVAGRKGFFCISITESSMNPDIGFAQSILQIIADKKVAIEHMPPGDLDSLSFIIDGRYRELARPLAAAMQKKYRDAEIEIKYDIALLAIVGEGMAGAIGTMARLTKSVAAKGINLEIANQGAIQRVILLGVKDEDADNAIRAIYHDCIAPVAESSFARRIARVSG